MIILDTNVVSEPMKLTGHQSVQYWLDQQEVETLYLTTISLSELLVGVAVLPEGKRKVGLDKALHKLLVQLFGTRILSFDLSAALSYSAVITQAKCKGYTLSVADAQIAAIATARKFVVATRDTEHFIASGVSVINPWG